MTDYEISESVSDPISSSIFIRSRNEGEESDDDLSNNSLNTRPNWLVLSAILSAIQFFVSKDEFDCSVCLGLSVIWGFCRASYGWGHARR